MAGLGFLAAAVWMSYPLIQHLGTHVPGAGSSEDLKFVWNFWWMRTAAITRPFDCPLLFAPFGISLVLDTHIALPAMIGATLLRSFDVVVANNLVVLSALTLNGWLAFTLAYRQVGRVLPSVLAGLIFGSSAYVAIHLLGHFNLIHVWTLPLVAIAIDESVRRPRWSKAILVGVAFATTTYIDYYYTIYAGVFAVLWWLVTCYTVDWNVARRPPPARAIVVLVAGGMVLLLGLIIAVALSGGFDLQVSGRRISVHHSRNPRSALWILIGVTALLRWRIAPTVTRVRDCPSIATVTKLTSLALATYAILIAPLVQAVWRLMMTGDYVPASLHWLSDPPGIDLATMVLGHPLHTFLWSSVQHVYSGLGIHMIEQTAWAGAVPLVLLGLTLRPGRLSSLERQWVIVGLVFFVWALGPFLTVAGKDTALILPHAVLRYLPILSNARIPGRAFIVVQLAVAMLCAFAVVRLKLTRATIVALAAMILLDSLTMPFQLDLVPTGGAVEQALKSPTSPPGAVLELPIGVADGFGELGQFDFRSLAWQVRHGRPLVGGFVARVPDRVKTAYLTNPVLQRLLELSAQTSTPPDTTPEPVEMSPHLTTLGIRFVVINRDKAPAALVTFAFARLNLRPVTKDGPRELYAIQD